MMVKASSLRADSNLYGSDVPIGLRRRALHVETRVFLSFPLRSNLPSRSCRVIDQLSTSLNLQECETFSRRIQGAIARVATRTYAVRYRLTAHSSAASDR